MLWGSPDRPWLTKHYFSCKSENLELFLGLDSHWDPVVYIPTSIILPHVKGYYFITPPPIVVYSDAGLVSMSSNLIEDYFRVLCLC
jgi:hypothetical protein